MALGCSASADGPSPRVFGRVLGLFRTGATLKTGKLLRLEISVAEIADLLGYSKTTVEAVLRWLGSGPIEYQGDQLSRGLGIIHRGRRTAFAYLDGVFRRVYRTSRLVLTMIGRMLLGLGPRDEERAKEKRQARARQQAEVSREKAKQAAAIDDAPALAEQEHIQGHGDDGGGDLQPDTSGMTNDVGRHWLSKIIKGL